MELIRFQTNDDIVMADISYVNSHVISLTFKEQLPEVYLTGFNQLNKNNGTVEGEYLDYTTLYRTYDWKPLTIELSNDESVYVEPEPTPDPDPVIVDPYVPTLEEAQSTKIQELSSICNSLITSGVDVTFGETIEHFSYNVDDQANIDDLFNLATATGLDQPYHADETGCKLYTPLQIIELYIAQKINKTHHTTYYNQLKMYILNELTTVEEVNDVYYGQELTGVYLENYNAMMAQGQLIIQTVLAKAGITETPTNPTETDESSTGEPDTDDGVDENAEPKTDEESVNEQEETE